VRTIIETRDGNLWFGTYPYAVGFGGISIARNMNQKSMTDNVLDLLPEPSLPKQLHSGEKS
jgi:Two component regulator propeller